LLSRCPACESDSVAGFDSPGNLVRWRCDACGLLFLNPQPTERVRHKYIHEIDLAEYFGARAARKRVLFKMRVDELPVPAPGSNRLCDVGCGDGLFLELACNAGWDGC